MSELKFRFATRADIPLILSFIKELATYEKLLHEVSATEELLEHWIFEKKVSEVIIGEYKDEAVGFALFFHNFSTFLGKAGLYLEDIYINPKYRSKGCGKAFMKKLATIALERDCGRMEWVCLDWNEPSIKFYEKLGAFGMDEWTTHRLNLDKVIELANS